MTFMFATVIMFFNAILYKLVNMSKNISDSYV